MTTDTAHRYWNDQWVRADGTSKWAKAEPEVLEHAATLPRGARLLDLGAGIGRHALAFAEMGFRVTALDAAPQSLASIGQAAAEAGRSIDLHQGMMTNLPFGDATFDHVLSWNVIYHGDEEVVRRSLSEIERVLRPGGTFMGTMLSARRLPVEQAKAPGREISRNTWVFEGPGDKMHPHYFCTAAELLALMPGFEIPALADREHDSPGSWHWHLLAERLA
jgi:ubiquinone/menaquinone biosynthesis C-methylase UbiE